MGQNDTAGVGKSQELHKTRASVLNWHPTACLSSGEAWTSVFAQDDRSGEDP